MPRISRAPSALARTTSETATRSLPARSVAVTRPAGGRDRRQSRGVRAGSRSKASLSTRAASCTTATRTALPWGRPAAGTSSSCRAIRDWRAADHRPCPVAPGERHGLRPAGSWRDAAPRSALPRWLAFAVTVEDGTDGRNGPQPCYRRQARMLRLARLPASCTP